MFARWMIKFSELHSFSLTVWVISNRMDARIQLLCLSIQLLIPHRKGAPGSIVRVHPFKKKIKSFLDYSLIILFRILLCYKLFILHAYLTISFVNWKVFMFWDKVHGDEFLTLVSSHWHIFAYDIAEVPTHND